ncbi:hypothetical protein BJX61DRAFT_547851 [Aspergillus egyptiacus]|nr:hypothetical protein BJX61DRAFT_547851 [Aspergillus egyptiacus]
MTSPKYETQGPPSAEEDWMTWLQLGELEGDPSQQSVDLDSVWACTASSLDVNHSSVDGLLPPQDHSQQAASWGGRSVDADSLRNDGGGSSGLTQTNDSPFVHHDPGSRQAAFNTDYGVTSDSSVGSFDSFASSASASVRRRRRQAAHSDADTAGRKARGRRTAGRRYQCTFCTDAFKTKYDWQRHETSMHLSLEQWKCSRFGPVIRRSDGHDYCVFCNLCDPSAEHPELHNYSACVAQPDEARLFYRKDHLQQHLRLFHRGCSFNDSMKGWLSYRNEVKSRCGFCSAHMESWTERQKHLAAHFRMGADMKEWKGDRGFDQQVDEIVEDDIPVFLIGD